MNFRFARIPLPTLPAAHQSIGNHDKHVSRSSNSETQAAFVVHYLNSDNRAKKGYQRRNTSHKMKENCQSPWFEKPDLNFRQINTVIEVLPIYHCGVVSLASKLFQLKCCYHRAHIMLVHVCRAFLVYFCALVSDIWS